MRNLATLLFSCLIGASACHAQLSGDLVIGSGGDYPTIGEAVDALMEKGVGEPVRFIILEGEYSEQVTIGEFDRLGAPDALVTFEAEGLGAVIWRPGDPKDTSNWIVNLDGADNVRFAKLAFETGGGAGGQFGRIFRLTGEAQHITIEDCTLKGVPGPYSAGNRDLRSLIYEDGNDANDHLTVRRTRFTAGYAGVDFDFGGAQTNSSDFQVYEDNEFVDQYFAGVTSMGRETRIVGNKVSVSGAAAFAFRGLQILSAGSLIVGNEVSIQSPDASAGITLSNSGDASPMVDRVYNNMVSMSVERTGGVGFGIQVARPDAEVTHNTVRLSGDTGFVALWMDSVSPCCPMTVKNNLAVHESGGTALRIKNFQSIAEEDYNNVFSTDPQKVVRLDDTEMSLATWKSISPFGASSVSEPVSFANTSSGFHDLRLDPPVNNNENLLAPMLADVTDDIDGEARGMPMATMGADEAPFIPDPDPGISFVNIGGGGLLVSVTLPDDPDYDVAFEASGDLASWTPLVRNSDYTVQSDTSDGEGERTVVILTTLTGDRSYLRGVLALP